MSRRYRYGLAHYLEVAVVAAILGLLLALVVGGLAWAVVTVWGAVL